MADLFDIFISVALTIAFFGLITFSIYGLFHAARKNDWTLSTQLSSLDALKRGRDDGRISHDQYQKLKEEFSGCRRLSRKQNLATYNKRTELR